MRRWIKNVTTADRNVQGQHIFAALTAVANFILVDYDSAGSWANVTQATDGMLNSATPSQFSTPNTQAYLFSPGDVGRFLALRDTVNPVNSGIYRIVSVLPGGHTVNLNAPVANFQGVSTGVTWTLYDLASKPPDGAYFVIQATTAPAWQARVIVSAAAPAGVQFELAAMGGWDTSTNAWLLPVSNRVVLNNTTATTFAVMDEQLGAFFVWSEDNAVPALAGRTGVFCGTFAGIHSPGGQGVPRDDTPCALIGDNTTTADTLNRLLTGGASGFAINGQINVPDKTSYVSAFLHQWRRVSDDSDVLADAGALTDPRSGQADSYGTVVYQTGPTVAARGFVPLIRIVNDFIPNRTPLNSGTVYVVQDGIAVEWDASAIV